MQVYENKAHSGNANLSPSCHSPKLNDFFKQLEKNIFFRNLSGFTLETLKDCSLLFCYSMSLDYPQTSLAPIYYHSLDNE